MLWIIIIALLIRWIFGPRYHVKGDTEQLLQTAQRWKQCHPGMPIPRDVSLETLEEQSIAQNTPNWAVTVIVVVIVAIILAICASGPSNTAGVTDDLDTEKQYQQWSNDPQDHQDDCMGYERPQEDNALRQQVDEDMQSVSEEQERNADSFADDHGSSLYSEDDPSGSTQDDMYSRLAMEANSISQELRTHEDKSRENKVDGKIEYQQPNRGYEGSPPLTGDMDQEQYSECSDE